MTCAHCCGAEYLFDTKEANKNLKRFHKKGPNKTTSKLLTTLLNQDIKGFSHLDIGGGIGAIQLELLKNGVSKTTGVDASTAYLKVAEELLVKSGFTNSLFIHGDFNDNNTEIEKHNIVTLERVVCCYPHVESLIDNSTAKAINYYAFVYPNDSWFAKIVNQLAHIYFKIKKNPFRTQIHYAKMMHERIENNGFTRIYYGNQFPWKIAVYKRTS